MCAYMYIYMHSACNALHIVRHICDCVYAWGGRVRVCVHLIKVLENAKNLEMRVTSIEFSLMESSI